MVARRPYGVRRGSPLWFGYSPPPPRPRPPAARARRGRGWRKKGKAAILAALQRAPGPPGKILEFTEKGSRCRGGGGCQGEGQGKGQRGRAADVRGRPEKGYSAD